MSVKFEALCKIYAEKKKVEHSWNLGLNVLVSGYNLKL